MLQPISPSSSLENVVTVAKSGGDFTLIQDAIDSITDASSVNTYVIDVAPGAYTENVTVGSWMKIVGRGDGSDVVITSASGTTVTLPSGNSFLSNVFIQNTPTASGSKCIDASSGGIHTIFFCFIQNISSTNGITGNLITAGSTSTVTVVESLGRYTHTGSAVGTNTHNVIDLADTAVLRYFRSDCVAVVDDVDDNVVLLNDDSTARLETSTTLWEAQLTNASYSGTVDIWKHTKNGSFNFLGYSELIGASAGGGTCNAIKMDTTTDDGVINIGYNTVNISGFDTNLFADVGTGDTLNSSYDFNADSLSTTGAGIVNFFGSFASGQLKLESAGEFTIDTANEWHGMSNFSTDICDNATLTAGTSGSITAIADAGGGDITVTSATHGLAVDDPISITGTTNYNAVYSVLTIPTADTFTVTAAFGADESGFFDRPAYITVLQRGRYSLTWSMDASSAANNKIFGFAAFKNDSILQISHIQRKFSSGGDIGALTPAGLFDLEKDDKVWPAIQNTTDATNITISDSAFFLTKQN